MNRLLSRVAAALLCLAVAFPAAAALDADAILVYGDSWRRVLPTYAAAARAPGKRSEAVADLPPVILWREGEERWTTELLRSLEPKKVVVIGPPGLTSIPLEIPGSVERIEADDASIDGILAARAFGPADRPPAVYVDDGVGIASALASAILAAADRSPFSSPTAISPPRSGRRVTWRGGSAPSRWWWSGGAIPPPWPPPPAGSSG